MPLCSVEVPKGVGPEVVQKAQGLALKSLKIVHQLFEVPDPEDLEINVIGGEGEQTGILISYTVGPNEYPDSPNPFFEPTDKQINQAGKEIHVKANQGNLKVAQTTIEAWDNTTFIVCNPEAPGPTQPPEDLKGIGRLIKKPRLTLIISPKKQQGSVALPREVEPTTESEPNHKFIEGVGKKLSEVLGLPEDTPISIHVQPTLFADTDFAVVFDCQPDPSYQISGIARTYMAQLVEQELNQNPSTRDGTAEVWVRQGQPISRHFIGE